jgi:hypothetical protein
MNDDRSTQEPAGHDAQRELEHRALRNVRHLVDRIQADDEARRRNQKWVIAGIAAIVVVMGAVIAVMVGKQREASQEIVISPVSKAPAR